ncbi:MAG: mannonate dehydratase [Mucilaginibacter polytrichastri]|nr:mannonate dehydratase [Mucilaginibacter polytrichastri]
MNFLEQTFRWYGPNDLVTLPAIRQTGATGIVNALHQIKAGEIWPVEAIAERKQLIEKAGLRWSVVESVNVHESIKTAAPDRDAYIEKYIATLKNLKAAGGPLIVCYNFMPVLDWTRTHLEYPMPDGSTALRFDQTALAAFELFILRKKGGEKGYSDEERSEAQRYFDSLSTEQIAELTHTMMAGLPGTKDVLSVAEFLAHLDRYADIDAEKLKENFAYFLRAIIPDAEKLGVKMCVHPDDPPRPIFGLPRIVSTEKDLQDIVGYINSPSNGITFCTGSLGANPANDLPGIVERLGKHFHFLHLRNVRREADGSFFEDDHLNGSSDMHAIMDRLVAQQQKRLEEGRSDIAIPMRPDHGHKTLYDEGKTSFPGYPLIGRMRGLAELRGLELGIRKSAYGL